MSGALGVLPRQVAFSGGVIVPGAQLFVYEDSSSSKLAIYTTSALAVEHTNPLEADAYGVFPAFYVDPAGGPYKQVLAPADDSDPPLAPLWTEDVIPIQGASIVEGSFTGTITGVNAVVTGTVSYQIITNAAGTGKACRLSIATTVTGVSDTTAFTLTGLPAAVRPSVAVWVPCLVHDNSVSVVGAAQMAAAASAITFYVDAPLSATGFTAANNKGLEIGWQIEYRL